MSKRRVPMCKHVSEEEIQLCACLHVHTAWFMHFVCVHESAIFCLFVHVCCQQLGALIPYTCSGSLNESNCMHVRISRSTHDRSHHRPRQAQRRVTSALLDAAKFLGETGQPPIPSFPLPPRHPANMTICIVRNKPRYTCVSMSILDKD